MRMQKQNNQSRIRRRCRRLFIFRSLLRHNQRSENEQRTTIERIKSEIVVVNRVNKIEFADSTLNRNMCYLVDWHTYVLHTYHTHITHSPPIRRMTTTAAAPADHIHTIFVADYRGDINI